VTEIQWVGSFVADHAVSEKVDKWHCQRDAQNGQQRLLEDKEPAQRSATAKKTEPEEALQTDLRCGDALPGIARASSTP
jgi:hypothetical protein